MYPSQKNRTSLAIDPLCLEQAKELAEAWGEGWRARLVVEKLIKDAIGEIEMITRIVDRETREVVCEVVTNHSMTFDEICRIGGLEYKQYPEVDTDGWYDSDGTHWSEEVAEIETVFDKEK